MRNFKKNLLRILVVLSALTLPAPATASLSYTFTTGTDIAYTAAGYTASGPLNLTLGFTPTPGTNLTVIKNTGLPFINGNFSNIPQGGTVPLTYNGVTYNYIANYYGGNGQSLVLQWSCIGLASWGCNLDGELGNNSYANSLVATAVKTSGTLAGKTVVALAGGDEHSLALTSDGKVFSWGSNWEGILGNKSTAEHTSVPEGVTASGDLSGKTVVAIAAKRYHDLALTSDGLVYAWGWNGSGQLGNNSSNSSSVPVAVNTTGVLAGKRVVAIAAGESHSLALTSGGQVFSWGENGCGQLGNLSYTHSFSTPVAVTTSGALSGRTVVAIAAGYSHSLALTEDGLVFAWGADESGQLGNNSTATGWTMPLAVYTTGALARKKVVAIAAGESHSLALTSSGQVYAWGANASGQLGNNSKINSSQPVAVDTTGVMAGKTIAAIAAGGNQSLAWTADGQVFAWGDNTFGQLGNNSKTSSAVPVALDTSGALAGKLIVGMAAGYYHNLVLFGSGSPSVTANPANQTATSGTAVKFTAAATNNPAPIIQWQVSTTGTAGPFSNITGNATATTGTLTLPNITLDQNNTAYRAVFTNNAGSTPTAAATLNVQRTFATFQNHYGLPDPDPKSDPNQTGISNLTAYAFGLNPAAPDRTQLPIVAFQNGNLQVTYPRWKDAADLTYLVEVSDDLQTWNSGPTYTQPLTLIPIDDTREQVIEQILPTANTPHRFIRVKIVTKP